MSDAPEAGTRVELLDRIAVGGMAEIFEGRVVGAAGFSKRVAVKRLLPHLAENAEFVAMFLDEARIASQLSHPNVVQIYELGRVGEGYFIVMEFVDGIDLRVLMRREAVPVSVGAAVAILSETLLGLGYAHERHGEDGEPLGIVHRDVSPANILIALDRAGVGVVKLTDFGVAKARLKSSRTVAGLLKGKLAYMSPEQARGLPVDARSDLFAASVILHELLVGRPLFEGATDFETLERLRSLEPPRVGTIRKEVPMGLDELVASGLSRDPARRPSSAREMRERLLPFANDRELASLLVVERAKSKGRNEVPAATARTEPGSNETLVFAPTVVVTRSRRRLRWIAVAALAIGASVAVSFAVVQEKPQVSGAVEGPPLVEARRETEVRNSGREPATTQEKATVAVDARRIEAARNIALVTAIPRASTRQMREKAARSARAMARRMSEGRRAAIESRVAETKTGTLTLQSKPYWGKIFLVGAKWPGKAETPAYRVPLPVGVYRVRVVYEPENLEATAIVTIEEGKETVKVVSFPVHTEGVVR